ncbi:MAG: hypothetical protein WBF21_23385 [Steroidobacteraceae bacterium]
MAKWQQRVVEKRRAGDLVALLDTAEAAGEEIEFRAAPGRGDVEREALMAVKRFTYNAAADCWPGWSIADTSPDPLVLARALQLAKRSAGLVSRLSLGPLQEGTGSWLCGAFKLALGRHQEAYDAFILAREHYIAANAPGLTMLTEGYIALLCQMAGPRVPVWREDLDQVCARIAAGGFEDGVEWIDQLRTARSVFQPKTALGGS